MKNEKQRNEKLESERQENIEYRMLNAECRREGKESELKTEKCEMKN
jgi:hypothetical protein